MEVPLKAILRSLRDANLLREDSGQSNSEAIVPLHRELENWALYVRDDFICPISLASRNIDRSSMYTVEEKAFIAAFQLRCTVTFRSCRATPKLHGENLNSISSHLKEKANFIIHNIGLIKDTLEELDIVMVLTKSDFIFSLTMATLCSPEWTKEEFKYFYQAICNELLVSRYLDLDISIIRDLLDCLDNATDRQSTLNGKLPLAGITNNLTWFGIADNEVYNVLDYKRVEKTNIAKKSPNRKHRSIHEIKYQYQRIQIQRTDKQKESLRSALGLVECRQDLWPYFIDHGPYINVEVFNIFDYGAMADCSESVEMLYSQLYEYTREYPQIDIKVAFILFLFPFLPIQHINLILGKRIKTKTAWQYESHGVRELFDAIHGSQNTTLRQLFNKIREFSGSQPITNR